jgi:hypothetical protein
LAGFHFFPEQQRLEADGSMVFLRLMRFMPSGNRPVDRLETGLKRGINEKFSNTIGSDMK